jgi:hypothetical protein
VGPADPAGHVDPEGDGQRPPPGDQQPVAAGGEDLGAAAGLVEGGDRHGDHAVAEGDQDEGAEELRSSSPHIVARRRAIARAIAHHLSGGQGRRTVLALTFMS